MDDQSPERRRIYFEGGSRVRLCPLAICFNKPQLYSLDQKQAMDTGAIRGSLEAGEHGADRSAIGAINSGYGLLSFVIAECLSAD